MDKQRGTMLLVVLMLILLAGWWTLPKNMPSSTLATSTNGNVLYMGSPIVLHHTLSNGEHTYAGDLPMRGCDSFSTKIQSSGANPVHLSLVFVITPPAQCRVSAISGAPFAVSVSTSAGAPEPVMDSIAVNGSPVQFSVSNE